MEWIDKYKDVDVEQLHKVWQEQSKLDEKLEEVPKTLKNREFALPELFLEEVGLRENPKGLASMRFSSTGVHEVTYPTLEGVDITFRAEPFHGYKVIAMWSYGKLWCTPEYRKRIGFGGTIRTI